MVPSRANAYRDFWPVYVRAHRNRATRRLHFVGTTAALLGVGAGLMLMDPLFVVAAILFGYAFAWIGHFLVERNRPASFGHPLWSLVGDLHMYALMWAGRIDAEVERVGTDRPGGACCEEQERHTGPPS